MVQQPGFRASGVRKGRRQRMRDARASLLADLLMLDALVQLKPDEPTWRLARQQYEDLFGIKRRVHG